MSDNLDNNVVRYDYREPDCLKGITALQSLCEDRWSCFKPSGFKRNFRGGRNRCIEAFCTLAKKHEVSGSFLGLEANRSLFMLEGLRGCLEGGFVNCEYSDDFLIYENQVPILRGLYSSLDILFEKQKIETVALNNPGKFAFIDYDAMKLIKPVHVEELVKSLVLATKDTGKSCLLISSVMRSSEPGGPGFLTNRYKDVIRPWLLEEISQYREVLETKSVEYRDDVRGVPMRVEMYVMQPLQNKLG